MRAYTYRDGIFPFSWKLGKLILIEKQNPTNSDQKKFRSICLLNAIGKAYENILNTKLTEELEQNANLNENQYGFRKGRSTIDAIDKVLNICKEAKRQNKWTMIILLDVKNAFNTADWSIIIKKLEKKHVSKILIKSISAYLSERYIEVCGGIIRRIDGGVRGYEGSVLGPTLWNVMYDDLMTTKCAPRRTNYMLRR